MTILALDFGGTKHTAGIILRGGSEWLAREQVFSPDHPDAHSDLMAMLSMVRKLLGGSQPEAVGVSFGGPVDARRGLVRLSHHVTGWENTPLAEILMQELGAPARVDNDANVAALGEKRYGAGLGYESLFYITVSTGVGGGWILNGRIWQGKDGMAGEIGHMVVDPDGPQCLCGKRGCVERLASGPYMALDARRSMESDPQCGLILRRLCQSDIAAIDGRLISQAAEEGDLAHVFEVLQPIVEPFDRTGPEDPRPERRHLVDKRKLGLDLGPGPRIRDDPSRAVRPRDRDGPKPLQTGAPDWDRRIEPLGHRMADEGGTLLLQEFDLPLLLCDEGIDAGGLAIEEGGDSVLFGKGGYHKNCIA